LIAIDAKPDGWRARAACAGTNPSLFYDAAPATIAAAKAVCSRCDVRAECLAFALETREPFGVWGGLDADERSALVGPSRPGPNPIMNDADLVDLFATTDRRTLARDAIEAVHEVSRQTTYKYLRRARDLGLVEIRCGTFYPRR
jgi:WhiB family transcriptional regulator, redox-sensing transcriptional regulator